MWPCILRPVIMFKLWLTGLIRVKYIRYSYLNHERQACAVLFFLRMPMIHYTVYGSSNDYGSDYAWLNRVQPCQEAGYFALFNLLSTYVASVVRSEQHQTAVFSFCFCKYNVHSVLFVYAWTLWHFSSNRRTFLLFITTSPSHSHTHIYIWCMYLCMKHAWHLHNKAGSSKMVRFLKAPCSMCCRMKGMLHYSVSTCQHNL